MINNKLYAEAVKFIDEHVDSDGFLDFNGLPLTITQCPIKDDHNEFNGQPAEFGRQDDNSQWDIYIWQAVKKPLKKALLLHELVEVMSYEKNKDLPKEDAHKLAVQYDQRYSNENLTAIERKALLVLRRKFS